MRPKEWTEEEILLAEDMHLAESWKGGNTICWEEKETWTKEGGDEEDEKNLMGNQPPVTQNPAPI